MFAEHHRIFELFNPEDSMTRRFMVNEFLPKRRQELALLRELYDECQHETMAEIIKELEDAIKNAEKRLEAAA